jgi:DNA-binding NarL/FixJ family response regulator
MSIKILLADDHRITRQGLRSLLEKESDMEVIAEAEDGHTTICLACELLPDVIVMDVTMPGLNGIETTRQILTRLPNIKVIALSMHSDNLFVSEMLKSGASGYLLKDCAFEELARAIRVVVDGKTYLSPAISEVVVDGYLHHLTRNEYPDSKLLTGREREVLQLIAEGNSTKQVALKLHVSVKTIETHRRQIMVKLKIHTIAELTKYAIRRGLTSLET